jgi:hypothetical protein
MLISKGCLGGRAPHHTIRVKCCQPEELNMRRWLMYGDVNLCHEQDSGNALIATGPVRSGHIMKQWIKVEKKIPASQRQVYVKTEMR